MAELLSYPFFQNALLIGLLCSLVCGVIGSFVVVKRMSFISGSIAHAAFGGLGLSYWLGFNPLLGAMGFGFLSALLMGMIRFRFRQQEDALIGALWAVGMSIGVICISLGSGYAGDLFGYLFGSILLTSDSDLLLMVLLNILVLGAVGYFYYPLVAITFDEDYASVLNLPVMALYLGLLELVTLTVIMLLKVVGTILVIALLTLPASAAANWTARLRVMMMVSVGIGAVSTVGGIFLATFLNFPPGPVIIFVCSLFYVASLLIHSKD